MAFENMITFGRKKESSRISASLPTPLPNQPVDCSQEALKETEVFQELNSVPKKDLLDYLENY